MTRRWSADPQGSVSRLSVLATLALAAGAAVPAHALTFNFDFSGMTGPNATSVQNGFVAAGQLWSDALSDDITINIRAKYESLGTGILGSTSTATVQSNYSSTRTAMIADAMSIDDLSSVAAIPVTSSLTFATNNRAGTRFLDADGSANNFALDVSRANAKALGLVTANDSALDATITFSSNFAFDFDRSNGINGAQFDFIGVAAHELGHALGFFSGVDTVDQVSGPNGPDKNTDLNGSTSGTGTLDPYRVFTVLDLFRHSSNQMGGQLDLAYGGTSYFSIDGGTTSLALFSTGDFNGDGQQASHWKDNLGLGIMDPTLAFGELSNITGLDLRAFDVIGYQLTAVPEPTSMALLGLGACALLRRHRRAA